MPKGRNYIVYEMGKSNSQMNSDYDNMVLVMVIGRVLLTMGYCGANVCWGQQVAEHS
ncbi:MAG: hypothetical protein IJ079_09480 [Lachnospiraceae bacterium]|nr:hypothetical protein [Lachnospiraceae bacterium]